MSHAMIPELIQVLMCCESNDRHRNLQSCVDSVRLFGAILIPRDMAVKRWGVTE